VDTSTENGREVTIKNRPEEKTVIQAAYRNIKVKPEVADASNTCSVAGLLAQFFLKEKWHDIINELGRI
jgi:hypothetical protein